MRRLLVFCVLLAAPVGAVQPAVASSGQITRAEANAGLTEASLSGRVDWSDCETARCLWIPTATVQPALPEYRCTGNEIFDSDSNTKVAWDGGGHEANGTASFELPHSPILTGVYGQRLCLSAIEKLRVQEPLCIARSPELGMDPDTCPFFDRYVGRVLATQLLAVRPATAPGAPTPPPVTHALPVLELKSAKAAANRALARRFRLRWTRGSHKRLRCKRLTTAKARCKVSWRYAGRPRRATVTVRSVGDNVPTQISS